MANLEKVDIIDHNCVVNMCSIDLECKHFLFCEIYFCVFLFHNKQHGTLEGQTNTSGDDTIQDASTVE